MPTTDQHLQQAEHNKAFLGEIPLPVKYSDWVITGYFYVAVHLLEAYLGARGKHSPDHEARRAFLRELRQQQFSFRNQGVYHHYQDLYCLSREARYDCHLPTKEEVHEAKDEHLPAIEEWVNWQLDGG